MKAAERHQALRDALVGAAERAIAANGLAALRARDLAAEVGCALGTIYTVFPDLDALILAANARALEAVDEALRAAPHEADPVARLAALADAYCAFAAGHRERWAAVFTHRMTDGRPVPGWYLDLQARLFRHVEAPLALLLPGIAGEALADLARAVFSAVHGVVSLGLDGKLGAVAKPALCVQARTVATAIARGLAHQDTGRAGA